MSYPWKSPWWAAGSTLPLPWKSLGTYHDGHRETQDLREEERLTLPMTTRPRPVTAEELFRKPDDGFRYELLRGELRKVVPAGEEHGYLAMEIGRLLGNHIKANRLGRVYAAETGFKISSDPDTVRRPRCRLREPRAPRRDRSGERLPARRPRLGGRSGIPERYPRRGYGEGPSARSSDLLVNG